MSTSGLMRCWKKSPQAHRLSWENALICVLPQTNGLQLQQALTLPFSLRGLLLAFPPFFHSGYLECFPLSISFLQTYQPTDLTASPTLPSFLSSHLRGNVSPSQAWDSLWTLSLLTLLLDLAASFNHSLSCNLNFPPPALLNVFFSPNLKQNCLSTLHPFCFSPSSPSKQLPRVINIHFPCT